VRSGDEKVPCWTGAAMSTVGFGVCQDDCTGVNWEHIQSQLFFAIIPWSVLVIVGISITTLAPTWSSNGRKHLQKYDAGLASRSLSSSLSVVGVHAIQSALFFQRASDKTVSGAYHAVEVISVMVISIDLVLGWSYTISRGKIAVLKGALHPLIMDCCIVSAPVAIIFANSKGEQTWFSFSFLAAARIFRLMKRVHVMKELVERGSTGTKIIYEIVAMGCFVYVSAMLLMVLEHLQVPSDPDESDSTWGVFGSVLYVVSTLTTVGDTTLAPLTTFGRFFCVLIVCANFYMQGPKVLLMVLDYLAGRNLGLGSFNGKDGHIIICGSASAPMLWDFLYEVYHLNHYESGDHFDREAPEVVILIPNRTTLRHIHEFLDRRDSLLFRHRVTVLRGEPSDHGALDRARFDKAEEIVVLPNMTTADTRGDDGMNIMRAFAIIAMVPEVELTCMLHTMDHRPNDFVYLDGKTTFLSIGAFKLQMLAKACLVPGVLSFMSNLCKTVGDNDEARGEAWQNEYEEGLGMEIYEVPLNESYHGMSFHEVATDILARSEHGNVYMIGTDETFIDPNGKTKNRVQIHPGCDYVIQNMQYMVQGVFIAGEIGDIVQKDNDDHTLGPPPSRAKAATLRGSSKQESMQEEEEDNGHFEKDAMRLMKNGVDLTPERKGSKKGNDAVEGVNALDQFFKNKPVPLTSEEVAKKKALKGYEAAMSRIGHKLLASGVDMGMISEICTDNSKHDKVSGSPGSPKSQLRPQLPHMIPAGGGAADSKKMPLRAVADAGGPAPQVPTIQGSAWSALPEDKNLRALSKFHRIQEIMETDVRHPREPPPSVRASGGHLLLCIVSSTSSETNTEVGDKLTPVSSAWDNHFTAFGAGDDDKIALDYDASSVLHVYDHKTADETIYKGKAAIQALFKDALFPNLRKPGSEDIEVSGVPVQYVQEAGAFMAPHVLLAWSSTEQGYARATDTFVFDSATPAIIKRQYVVVHYDSEPEQSKAQGLFIT